VKSGLHCPDFLASCPLSDPPIDLDIYLGFLSNPEIPAKKIPKFENLHQLRSHPSRSSVVVTMSKHNPDLVMCRRQTGISIGRLCERDDGRCPVCDSYVRPTTQVRICDECAFGNYAGTH
jgi:hypothetical protein